MSHWSLCAFILRLGKCKFILTISFLCNLFRFISFVLVWEEYEYVRPSVHIPLALAVHTGGLTNKQKNNKTATVIQLRLTQSAVPDGLYLLIQKRAGSRGRIFKKQNKTKTSTSTHNNNTTSTIGGWRLAVGLWSPIVTDAAVVSAAREEEETAVNS